MVEKNNYKRGFTLIELLVVIAIIGILSSIVLASLNSARNKGKDASAKASLSSLRSSAEIYYNGPGLNSYGTTNGVAAATNVCGETTSGVPTLLTAASSQVPAANAAVCTVGTPGNGGSYEAHITLNDNTFFCVDNNGFAGTIPSITAAPFQQGAAAAQAKCK